MHSIHHTSSLVNVWMVNDNEVLTTKCKGPSQQLVDPSGVKYTFSSVSCTRVRNPAIVPSFPSARLKFLNLRTIEAPLQWSVLRRLRRDPWKSRFRRSGTTLLPCIYLHRLRELGRLYHDRLNTLVTSIALTSRLASLKLIQISSPAWTLSNKRRRVHVGALWDLRICSDVSPQITWTTVESFAIHQ